MKRAIRVFPGGFVDHFLIFAREGFAKSHEKRTSDRIQVSSGGFVDDFVS